MIQLDSERPCPSRGLMCYHFDDGVALYMDAKTHEVVACDCSTPEDGYWHCEHAAKIKAKDGGADDNEEVQLRAKRHK